MAEAVLPHLLLKIVFKGATTTTDWLCPKATRGCGSVLIPLAHYISLLTLSALIAIVYRRFAREPMLHVTLRFTDSIRIPSNTWLR